MMDFKLFARRRVPFVTASQLNECGLACLAAISEYFQGELGLADLRRLAMPSGRGESLLHIRDLAEQIGLAARGLRVEVGALAALVCPAILHWDMNHFVVLERATRHGLVIMDPAAGRVAVPWAEVDKSFTGVVLECAPTAAWQRRRKQPRKVSLLNFVGPLSAWRVDIALIVSLSLLMELLVLVAPLQMQLSIDRAVPSADGRLVWVLGGAFLLVLLIQAAVSMIRAWAATVFGVRVGFGLMDRFVRALHRKPAGFFLKHHTADVLSRGRSVEHIQLLITAQLIQALLDALMSVAMVVVMFVAVPLLAAVVTGFGLLNIAVTAALRHAAIENSRRSLRMAATVDALFLENARAARAIRLFGKEAVRMGVWRNKFVELTNLHLTDSRLMMFSTQAAQFSSGLGNVALIAVGSQLVLSNRITLGTMMMFFVFRGFFVERLNHCATYLMDLRRVQTHAERIDEVLTDEPGTPERLAERAPFVVPPGEGVEIELHDVWFRYGHDSPWVLQGASLRVAAGESVAITGASGCGKSTLMGVMLGLLEPSRGEVRINGRPLASIATTDYARLIGVVMQDDTLFHGTVADNISFFDAPLDMARVQRAAEQAHIAHDIETMPMRYYSLLAEAATDISGGQKQRLFIARALYHEPPLLFLDEATSHLDSASERLVSQAVRTLRMTRVLIAHRQETIATADRVLLLEQGKVTQRAAAAVS